MSADVWEEIRHVTIDQLVTATKLRGTVQVAHGFTTPEGYPFVVLVAIAKPGSERVVEFAKEFMAKMDAAGAPLTRADNPKATPVL